VIFCVAYGLGAVGCAEILPATTIQFRVNPAKNKNKNVKNFQGLNPETKFLLRVQPRIFKQLSSISMVYRRTLGSRWKAMLGVYPDIITSIEKHFLRGNDGNSVAMLFI
jgi:hypothetical protein